MPKEFLQKVKYLCSHIVKEEWSGVLYYKIIGGSIQKPGKLRIKLVDIFLMDKGSSAYTEYSFDEKVVEHMMMHPELMQCKMGHIHSHNVMPVFFSGTDMSELDDNSANHNFYLSFIVNNFMNFTSKIAFRGTTNVEKVLYMAKDENGQEYAVKAENLTKEVVFIMDCEIKSPVEIIKVPDEFDARMKEIIQSCDKRDKDKSKTTWSGNDSGKGKQLVVFPKVERQFSREENMTLADRILSMEDADFDNVVDDYEAFAIDLITQGNYVGNPEEYDIESLLEDVFIEGRSTLMASIILDSYAERYTEFFKDKLGEGEKIDDINVFLNKLNLVIETFELEEETHPWVNNITMGLKSLGNKIANTTTLGGGL